MRSERYRWASPAEWLSEKIQGFEVLDFHRLKELALAMLSDLDSDQLQDLFQDDMEEDGYFQDLDIAANLTREQCVETYEKTDIQSQFDGEPIVRLNGILMGQSAAEEIIARDQAHDAMLAKFAASRILMVRAGRTSVRLVRIGGDTGMAALMATIAAHQYNYLWENAALDGDEA